MSISHATHNHFMQYVQLAQSLFDVAIPGGRHAIIVVGQPTELHEWGYVVVNGDCDSPLQGAGQLVDWLSDPQWVMDMVPGYVGPPLFLAHAERMDALTINVTSCLLNTVAHHTLHRTPLGVSLETLPVLDPWPSMVRSDIPIFLRWVQGETEAEFDRLLTELADRIDGDQ